MKSCGEISLRPPPATVARDGRPPPPATACPGPVRSPSLRKDRLVRRPPAGPRCRAPKRPRGGLTLALLAILYLAAPGLARAQTAKKAAAAPDVRPLARYVPRENLVLYLGSDGLDTQ